MRNYYKISIINMVKNNKNKINISEKKINNEK